VWIIALGVFVLLCAAVMLLSGGWLSPIAKREIVRALQQQYQSDLEIRSLAVSLFPAPHATGEALVFRQKDRPGAPPLITLRRFEAHAGWLGLLRTPRRVSTVVLEGLEIRVSHGEKKSENPKEDTRAEAHPKPRFVIDEIVADGTTLEILPKKEGKDPLQFDIYKLTMNSVGPNRPMRYRAELRNAKPPGLIHATGDFGPWNVEDAGQTPVTGKYQFSGADLSVFKGIRGTLSSTGEFHGPLERLEVSGQTDIPDFTLKAGNHPVHLTTTFNATVDGTDGDTLLHPVTAHFGQTTVVTNGGVTGTHGVQGKTVSLDGVVENGSLADVLRLGVKSDPPPMTGRISFHSKIVIPPGDRDIADKLRLKGTFDIGSGKFTSTTLQQKVATLSERAQGDTESGGTSSVATNLRGRFVLDDGTIALTGLMFRVPGATIKLDGTYGLTTEKLDFHGTATMEARLSQMTTGIKSFLLKALDPIFAKNHAGAVIPIRISGTRDDPSFGLELRQRKSASR
jgi:hypothetical protein